jgi:hypothetical protein
MARGRVRFLKSEVERATSAAIKAGLEVRRIIVDPSSGNIVLETSRPGDPSAPVDKPAEPELGGAQ